MQAIHEFLQSLDRALLLHVHQGWRSGIGDAFFAWITNSDHFLIPLALIWLLLIWRGGREGRILALLLAIGLLVTDQVSSHVIKPLVGRERPCFVVPGVEAIISQVRSRSFPSSHAANVFGAATLFWLARGKRWALAFVPAALVALSRVYLGVHYPSDILAGALLGLGAGWLIWFCARRLRARFGRRRAIVAALILGCFWGCGSDRQEATTVPAPGDSTPPWVTVVDTVRRGDTFSRLLLRNQLYLRDIERLLEEVRTSQLFSMRHMRPGETVSISIDLDGQLRQLQYEKSPDEVLVVTAVDDTLTSRRTGLPYQSFLRKLGGPVRTTVDEALRSSGAGPGIVLELATIFASDIDFLTEPRVDDRVVVLVEEKRYEGERVGIGPILYVEYVGRRVSQTGIQFTVAKGPEAKAAYYTPGGESLIRTFLRSPLNYRRISSRFSKSRMHPILRVRRPHLGVDYAAAAGTPVVALGEGVVTFAAWNGGFGRHVKIRHGSEYETSYGHLGRFGTGVRKGVRVKKGQVIGYVGSSGLSTGPHLDFRVRRRGAFIDPLKMVNPPTAPVPTEAQERFCARGALLTALADSLEYGDAIGWDGNAPVRAPVGGGDVAAEMTSQAAGLE